jgi:hypothetical protein
MSTAPLCRTGPALTGVCHAVAPRSRLDACGAACSFCSITQATTPALACPHAGSALSSATPFGGMPPPGSTTYPSLLGSTAATRSSNRSVVHRQNVTEASMKSAPALRLRGRGHRLRLHTPRSWGRDPLADLAATCRTGVAVDKALGESVRNARGAGHSWSEIAVSLGLPARLSGWDQIAHALAAGRRAVWDRIAGE